jgi:drug/metabolite transporter (DMT)-like permease
MKKLIGFSSLFLAGMTWGSFGIWIRLLNSYTTMYQQIVLRNVIAMIFTIVLVIVTKRYVFDLKNTKKLSLIVFGLTVPLTVIFYNIAMLTTKISITTFGLYVGTILFSTIFGVGIFKEKMTLLKVISLFCVGIGLFCFVYPFSINELSLGLLLAIVAGMFDSISNIFRKDLSGKIDKFILVLITTLGGMLISGIMMVYFKQTFAFIGKMPLNGWMVALLFGFLLAAVNYITLVGFQNFDLSIGTVVLSSELVFATIFAFLVFGERPLPKEIVGGIFVFLAVIIPNLNLTKYLKVKSS